jgi:hypothetical protein
MLGWLWRFALAVSSFASINVSDWPEHQTSNIKHQTSNIKQVVAIDGVQ